MAVAHDYRHYLLPSETRQENCFHKIPFSYRDTLHYVDLLRCQTFSCTLKNARDTSPAIIIVLDLDGNEWFLLKPERVKQYTPPQFKHSEIRSTIKPQTFSAHAAELFSPKHIGGLWNRNLLTKNSEGKNQDLSKALSYDFFHDNNPSSKTNKKTLPSYWIRQLRLGATDPTPTVNIFLTRN